MSLSGQVSALATRIATEINTLRGEASYVTPMRYGAAGDGVVDDTTAVQAAFDSGHPVVIDRPYLVGGLTASSGLAVHGFPGGVLKRAPTATYTISINPGAGGTPDPATNITGVQFVGVGFDDDVATNGFREGDAQLNLNACSDVLVAGCTFTGFRSDAIYLGSSNTGATERHNQRIKIVENWFDGVNKDNRNAISVVDCFDLVVESNTFRRCTRADMPGPIDIEPNTGNTFAVLRDFTISNNTFDGIGGFQCIGTSLAAASTYTTLPGNWNISGNTFLNVDAANAPLNLLFTGAATTDLARMNITVTDNTFIDVPRYAHFDGIRGVLFAGNIVSGSTGAGMVGGNYACLDLTFDRNEFFQVGDGDGGAPCAVNVVNGTYIRFDGNTFIDCGLVDGTWGMCVVFGGPGASDFVDFIGTNVMRAGTRMTDVSYRSSSHTLGVNTTYNPPVGAVGGSALPVTAPSGTVPTSRSITAGTGLTGGGDLSADRTLAVAYGTTAGTATAGNDARLSDTRTPTDSSVTDAKVAPTAAIAESKLNLASDAIAGTPSRRTLGTGAQQAAAGNDPRLSDQRTPTDASVTNAKVSATAAIAESKLNLASDAAAGTASRRTLGTGALQAAAGTHTHAYAPTTRTIATTSPLTGGGDLTADRTLGVSTGTTAGTVATGDHTHPAPAVVTQTGSGAITLSATAGNLHAVTATGDITSLAVSGTPSDAQRLAVEVYASGADRVVTHGLARMNGLDTALTVGSGQVCLIGLYYSSRAARWIVASFNEEA